MNALARQMKRYFNQSSIPLTKALLATGAAVFVMGLAVPQILDLLALSSFSLTGRFWGLLTYPLVNPEFFSLLFALLWLWFIGGSLEQIWGTRRYGLFVLLVTAVTGVAMALVESWVIRFPQPIFGFWLLSVGMTWAWAELFPEREILFWGIIPIQARWLAWLNALMIFFSYFRVHWLLGLAALSGILVAYLYTAKRGGGYRGGGGRRPQNWREDRERRAKRSRFRVIH
jgi:membrane associated rhomboid family serine protease